MAASMQKFSLWYVSNGDLSWKIISEWKPPNGAPPPPPTKKKKKQKKKKKIKQAKKIFNILFLLPIT